MFDIGFLYGIVASVAMILIILIYTRAKATKYKELIDKEFCKILLFFSAFCFVDMVWGLLTSSAIQNSRLSYVVFTYGFHLFSAFSAFMWAGYAIYYIKAEGTLKTVLNIFRYTFISIQITVLASNIWTGLFFAIDENSVYKPYKLRNFMFFLQFAYYFILILYSLYMLLKSKKQQKPVIVYLKTAVFSSVPFFFGIGQMHLPDAPMYSLGFMVSAFLIYSFNITDQREQYAKRILREENSKLSSILSGVSGDYHGLYYVDMETNKFEIYNKHENDDSIDILYGFDFFVERENAIASDIHPDDRRLVLKMLDKNHIKKELENKRSFNFNYRIKVGDDYRYYMTKIIKPAEELGEHVIIGVFDDDERVREEIEKQNEIKEAMKAAETANKAKTEFLFNMSHDIRTPMNAILGFTEMAQKHLDEKQYLEECLSKVKLSGEHLLSLINDVLDMSRIESGKVKMNLASESVIKLCDKVICVSEELFTSKSIAFTHEYVDITNKFIECDSLYLGQILFNIFSNASKYTNEGGKVDFKVKQTNINGDKVFYSFEITDNGIGMSPEFLPKVFNEFEREKNTTASNIQGTGLGMSIVKKLLDLMDGKIEIQSEKDKGTKVIISIPFAIGKEVYEKNDDLTLLSSYSSLKGKHILLVDDNALNREIAVDMLSDLGLEVDEAGDGVEAVKLVKENISKYDYILMDVQMPLMNGYDATKAIRALDLEGCDTIPIIAMTANAFEEDKKNAFEAGMNSHLGKPVNVEELSNVLLNYVNKK